MSSVFSILREINVYWPPVDQCVDLCVGGVATSACRMLLLSDSSIVASQCPDHCKLII